MNQECIGCPQGTQMRAKIIEAHVRREESQTTLDALDAQIAECTTLQIMSGVRRRLRQNRTTYLTEVYLPASHDYVMSIPLSGRLEQCPGPFDPSAFGIQNPKEVTVCGTEIVGVRSRLGALLLDNDTAADNPGPIIENS